jgi:hypothetical protein
MKAKALLVALALAATPALADNCSNEMQVIDNALPNVKQRTAGQMNEIKRLRVQGEKLHNAGKHPESLAVLAKAKQIMGIK